MNSDDDAPPSYPTGAMSSFNQNEPESTDNGFEYSQPPSRGAMVHGQENQSQEEDQTAEIIDDNKPPSRPAVRHGQVNSYNQDPNTDPGFGGDSNASGAGGRPLSRGDFVKVHDSETSGGGGGGGGSYTEDKALSFDDMGHRGTSDTGPSPAAGFDADEKEFEGVSMSAKPFRNFRPNAYYKKEEDE